MDPYDHSDLHRAEQVRQQRHARRQKHWQRIQALWDKITTFHRRSNQRLSHLWSDGTFTTAAVGAIFLVAAIMLWLPSYLGMANDGTVTRTMQNAGLSYLEADASNANDYFTRVYQTHYADSDDHSFQLVLLQLAHGLDNLFTHDQLFDIRFLSILYVLLALPGWAMLVHSIVRRADAFVEKCVLCVLCVLVFADVSYLTYFNSLYPEAIYQIGLSYLFGGCMMLQQRSRFTPLHWLTLVIGTLLLCTTRSHCGVVGFVAALFCIAQLRLGEQTIGRVGAAVAAVTVLIGSFCSFAFVETDFDATSKVHAMTRGVLLQSTDPDKTLQEFNIDGSYALLADSSLYDVYALTEESEYYLQNGFLNQYTTTDIAIHYLRHPRALLSMLDLGVRSATDLRRTYCGNYERTVGMPAQGRSIFFAAYSIFKSRSLPHTIAFPLLLVIVCAVLSRSGWWRQKDPDRFYYVYFCTTMAAAIIAIAHLTEVICLSGDAQLTQYSFIAGYSLDCLLLFTAAELLHRLNILEETQVNHK